MVETVTKFCQVKREKLFLNSAVLIQPMLRITPEPFDSVDMVSTSWPALLFSHDDMFPTNRKARIRLPVVGVVEAAGASVFDKQSDDFLLLPRNEWEGTDRPVSLEEAKHDELSGRAPATFSRVVAAEAAFIALKRAFLRRLVGILRDPKCFPNRKVEAFDRTQRRWTSKAETVSRHSEDEILEQAPLGRIGDPKVGLDSSPRVRPATVPASIPQIAELPSPMVPTVWAATTHLSSKLSIS
jgi:hypothetical protein